LVAITPTIQVFRDSDGVEWIVDIVTRMQDIPSGTRLLRQEKAGKWFNWIRYARCEQGIAFVCVFSMAPKRNVSTYLAYDDA